jgi:Rod binding domain-containing protein
MASVAFDGVLQGAAAAPAGAAGTSGKIHAAAQQFEALLIGEMLKSERDAGEEGWMGSGDSAGGDSAMDLAENQFAQALAMNGGLGLSQTIERSVAQQNARVTAHQQGADAVSGSHSTMVRHELVSGQKRP